MMLNPNDPTAGWTFIMILVLIAVPAFFFGLIIGMSGTR